MDVDIQGTLSILHIPTVVSNNDGDTFIRVFYATSLGTKLEVEISTYSLLDTATTPSKHRFAGLHPPPQCINRHTKSVKQVGNIMWATTRAPLVTRLVGNTNVTSVRFDEESTTTMDTECYPIALH